MKRLILLAVFLFAKSSTACPEVTFANETLFAHRVVESQMIFAKILSDALKTHRPQTLEQRRRLTLFLETQLIFPDQHVAYADRTVGNKLVRKYYAAAKSSEEVYNLLKRYDEKPSGLIVSFFQRNENVAVFVEHGMYPPPS